MWNIESGNSIDSTVKILEQREKKVFPDAKVVYIKPDLYAVDSKEGNIQYFLHENGEIYFNIWAMAESPFYEDSLKKAWYVERKENWTYNMYRVDSNWRIADKPVDKYSIDYFNLWKNIDFFIWYHMNRQVQSKRLSREQFLEILPMYQKEESFRIKDLMIFYSRWQINKMDVIGLLPALQKLLVKQCNPNSDLILNFEKVNDPITEDELRKYYNDREIFKNKGLIDENTYLACLSWLRKSESEKKIKRETKEEIKK
ncbi:MAG: hypothetical protein ACD_3C00212G0002 [uncultured bacterium (gcode 4)]|uniref:Uncharacterized protein n=1 Tax=uncultured bacterium (gcode 4) TaxID=1234023 RepID=K2FWP3_9BACT|nr:MAG: hypothetical protein ACD_3C00212G0002 [uncultured bacterium (gcode 4)]